VPNEVTFRCGDVIFGQGDPPNRLYLTTAGKVRLGRHDDTGRTCLYTVVGPGEVFGEVAMFDASPHSEMAVAMTDVRALAWNRSQLDELFATDPTAAEHLLRVLARRIRRASDDITDLMSATVAGRVAKHLLRLAQQFGEQHDGAVRVALDLNQEQLAQLTGTSRECVNRALSEFSDSGWIRLEQNTVVIMERQPLVHCVHGARRIGTGRAH
jgi:CRP-like cAMP-binding protein